MSLEVPGETGIVDQAQGREVAHPIGCTAVCGSSCLLILSQLTLSTTPSQYLAEPGIEGPTLLDTEDLGHAYGPSIAADDSGDAFVAWRQDAGTQFNIWADKYTPGLGWGTAELIEHEDFEGTSGPSIASDGLGNAIAAWYQFEGSGADVSANRYDADTGWGTPRTVS
jgi:hypothetical protein